MIIIITIIKQLKYAVIGGHDVQLHLHPTYFNAQLKNGAWEQDPGSYILKEETYDSLFMMIKQTKDFLTRTLIDVKKDYNCIVFRAGGWQMQPTNNIVRALTDNGFKIDTSVFKNGKRGGTNSFDYSSAHHSLLPWPVDENEICQMNQEGRLIEIPIYTEQRSITSFISLNRMYRLAAQVISRLRVKNPMTVEKINLNNSREYQNNLNSSFVSSLKSKFYKVSKIPFNKYSFKMDYNQCTGKQLINGLLNAEKKCSKTNIDIPFVIIGHSKTFTRYNESQLKSFLKFVKDNPDRFKFSLFSDLDLSTYYKIWST
ncbi:MAG: hypothetical protein HKO83_14720 [Ignavibacteriaceae bacterium]|nr:hypothetical protein [Ignavibacteriaceae bacterium]